MGIIWVVALIVLSVSWLMAAGSTWTAIRHGKRHWPALGTLLSVTSALVILSVIRAAMPYSLSIAIVSVGLVLAILGVIIRVIVRVRDHSVPKPPQGHQ